MRKLLLVTLLLFSLGNYHLSFSQWYDNIPVLYTDPGTTLCPQGDPTCTICPNDGDMTGGQALGYTNDIAVTDSPLSLTPNPASNSDLLNSVTTNATLVGSGGGTMYCLKWDAQNPEPSTLLQLDIKNNKGGDITSCIVAGSTAYCKQSDIRVRYNVIGGSDLGGAGIKNFRVVLQKQSDPSIEYISIVADINSFGPNIDISGLGEGLYNTFVYTVDNAGNESTPYQGANIFIDTVAPVASDIGDTTPTNNSNLLATNSQNISVTVDADGGSPIIYIQGVLEDSNAVNDYLGTVESSNSTTFTMNGSISNVDNDRDIVLGGREYSFKITYILDRSGNSLGTINDAGAGALKTFNYNVYANSILLGSKDIITNELDDGDVADGSIKNLIILLEDTYGNEIVPATGISRNIALNFSYLNTLKLNQYTPIGDSAVYSTVPMSGQSNNYMYRHNSAFSTFYNLESTNGTYPFKFKVYAPTYNEFVTDGRELAQGVFNINYIRYRIQDDFNTSTSFPQFIDNDTFDFSFIPLYNTQITGDLYDYGFIEGATQTGTIDILANGSESGVSDTKLYLEFGSGSQAISPTLDLSIFSPGKINIGEGNTNYTEFKTGFSNGSSYALNTLLTQSGGLLDDIQNTYLSTHISYDITAPNGAGTITVVYNSDIIGKSNYWGSAGTDNTIQVGLKVYGNTQTQEYNQLTNTQDIKIIGKSKKALIKRDLRKKIFEVIKNVPHDGDGSQVDILNGKVEYYKFSGSDAGENKIINLGDYNTLLENKTLVIYGGNIYITGNITPSSNLLGMVVLKDSDGNGGNIYVDPSVTQIDAIMYADKSLMSYNILYCSVDGEISSSCGGTQEVLKNQLYIYGSLFTENTIGASRKTPPVCPYYVSNLSCTQEVAQKYDLNYLRRYFIYDSSGPGGVPDGVIDSNDDSAKGGASVFVSTEEEYFYPVVIKYNQKIQLTPPPLFEK